MRFISWTRQRRIRYPFHICGAANDNWCPWAEYIP